MLRVLGRNTSGNVMKVMWTADALGLACTREDVGGKFGGNDTPEYLALNPNGLVPTLIDGETVVWESNTICRYLCNKVGATPLYPAGPAERSLCERWMDWQLSALSPMMTPLFIKSVRVPKPEQNPAEIAALRDAAEPKWRLVDAALAKTEYLAGRHLTLADIANGFAVHRWIALGFDRGNLPRLAAWYERLQQHPGYVKHISAIPIA